MLLIASEGEAHPFPAKPLRESQSRLLSNGQSWTERDETEEQGVSEGGYMCVAEVLKGIERYYKQQNCK